MCVIQNIKINNIIKRLLDIIISFLLLIILIPVFILIVVFIKIDSNGDVIFWSQRFEKNKKLFLMPKFRTMRKNTPIVDTKSLKETNSYVTKVGRFLRKTSLDELPQLFSVLIGKMSLVGPRPALFTQIDLINLRDKKLINNFKPGITGLAQINGRDNISLEKKVSLEYEYTQKHDICFDIKILFITIFGFKWLKDISH